MSWHWAAWGIGGLLGLGALIYGVGAALPREHVAQVEVLLPASPAHVASIVRDVEAQPRWRRDVRAIEVRQKEKNAVRYVERSRQADIAFELIEEEPGRRFRSLITDQSLPFGGYWTFLLSPEGEGTRLRIEEHGVVKTPIFRFVSRFVLGHEATLRSYVEDMEKAVAVPR